MNRFKIRLLLFLLSGILFTATAVAAQTPSKILLLPFKIHSEKNLSFLNRGISSMLASRLSASGKAAVFQDASAGRAVLEAPDGSEIQVALKQASALGAQYVVTGSLTVFGSSVSTDAKLIGVAEQRPLVTFSQVGTNTGDVIAHIHQFAAQVNTDIFGMVAAAPRPAYGPVVSAAPAVVAPPAAAVPAPVSAAIPQAAPKSTGQQPQAPEIWRSSRIKDEIRSMAAGDVDGDGQVEIAMAVGHDITVHRYEAGRLTTVAEIKGESYETLLGVDVADINGNGRAELYITRLNRMDRLSSSVMEWSGSGFRTLAQDLNWYFRVTNGPADSPILVGQRRRSVGPTGSGEFEMPGSVKLFMPGIFQLDWAGSRLEAGQRLNLPKGIFVYGFAFGDVMGKGQPMVVALTESNRLRIFDQDGRKEWTASDRYGGSSLYMEYPSADDKTQTERYYLLQRVLVADLNRDGRPELLVSKNKDIAGGFLKSFRRYSSGNVNCLSWETVTMKTRWQTEEISGYVSDINLSDLDRNGRQDLIYTVVSGEGGMMEKPTSYVVVQWNLN